MLARDSKLSYENAKCCFLPKINAIVAKKMGLEPSEFLKKLNEQKIIIITRGTNELAYCEDKIEEIKKYTYEQAITELIRETKLEEKISVIHSYLSSLEVYDE